MKKLFSLIYSGEVREGSEAKVIPAQDFSRLLKTVELLKEAKRDCAIYLEKNKEACQKLLDESAEAGFNQGLTEFNKQILHYEECVKEIRHELQQMVLTLALRAAKKIVGRELELFPETIVDIVQQTLKPVTQNHHVKIFVSKEDREILEKKKQKIREILEHVKTFKIEEKEGISAGSCIIETEAGIINASLDNQWRALESAFASFMKQ